MAYPDAFGRWERFGDKPLDPCPNSSGQDRFKPTPCSWAGVLISLVSKGAATEPPLSVNTSGWMADPLTTVLS